MIYLLIGSPCSGKTTIGKLLSQSLACYFWQFDYFIDEMIKSNGIKQGSKLNEDDIDVALSRFIQKIQECSNDAKDVVFELPYHDYTKFFKVHIQGNVTLTTIAFIASDEELLNRNEVRYKNSKIPEEYIKRCNSSLLSLLSVKPEIIAYNTENNNIDAIIMDILIKFNLNN